MVTVLESWVVEAIRPPMSSEEAESRVDEAADSLLVSVGDRVLHPGEKLGHHVVEALQTAGIEYGYYNMLHTVQMVAAGKLRLLRGETN